MNEPPTKLCQDCGINPASRRSRCWRCYTEAKKKRDYQRFKCIGLAAQGGPAPEPTKARPGSPEKEKVLTDRALQGVDLHHPEDATLEDCYNAGNFLTLFTEDSDHDNDD